MKRFILAAILMVCSVCPRFVLAAALQGSLVKVACPSGADSSHPCRAVYFYGHDGKRHAFSNDKVYFTWYSDFSTIKTISSSEMAALPLGSNIVYRPGSKMVKFVTDPKLYAVGLGGELRWITSESVAAALYGADWNKKVDDILDAFFVDYRFGSDVAVASAFSPQNEGSLTPNPDDNLPATERSLSVVTTSGTYAIELLKLQSGRYRMITDAAETADCGSACPALPLATFAQDNAAKMGIHGTYFCPPDYPECASKMNTFLWPFFDSASRVMLNASSLPVHEGPMLTAGADGALRFYHRTKDVGSVANFEATTHTTLTAAISNYPSLIENSVVVVNGEAKLDDGMKTVKGTRGGIGVDDHFVYLVIAKSATVIDLATIFASLGARNAMNLDGGGSAALLFDGKYVVGPGRELPNAILFVAR